MTLREQYFADLYRGYLSRTPAELADLTEEDPFTLTSGASWPANADVPRLCPHDDAEATVPCIAITATEEETKHPQIMDLTVFIRVHCAATVDDGGPDPHGTPMDTAQAWVQAISEALYAQETFRAHLLTLTQEQRTGGEIKIRWLKNGVAHEHNKDNRTHTWEIQVTHKVNCGPG